MTSTGTHLASPLTPPGWAGVATCALGEVEPSGPWRPEFHALLLATAGHGTIEVDFAAQICRPGTLLWIRPGQALRIGSNGLAASVVTFESRLFDNDHLDETAPARWQLEGED